MNNKIRITILAIICAFSAPALANDGFDNTVYSSNTSFMEELFSSDDKDVGFHYHVTGDAEEEGALKLFVKDTTSKHDLYDPSVDSLSQISPAAGVQLQFDF